MSQYPTYKFTDIASLIRGVSYDKSVVSTSEREGDIPILRANNIQKDLILNDLVYVPSDFVKEEQMIRKGDIVLAMSSGSKDLVGKSAQANKDINAAFGTFCGLIRAKENIDSKFLGLYFQTQEYRNFVSYQSQGVNICNLKKKDIESLQIPLPPLATQRAIVTRIETLFAELDKAVQHLRTAQQQLKTYRQAVLNETMNATKFVPVGEVITEMGQGWSPKCCNEPSTSENEWGVIKTTAIQSCCFIEEENKKLPKNLEPRLKHELKAGDILITRAGPKVRVGVCCLIKKTRPKLINCDKAYRVVLNRDMIDAQYFEYVINSPTCIKKLDELKTGISDSGVNLTQSRFYDLQIPFPPLTEQQRIVQEIESRLSQATATETYIENALQQAEALRQSILKKAFSGDLV